MATEAIVSTCRPAVDRPDQAVPDTARAVRFGVLTDSAVGMHYNRASRSAEIASHLAALTSEPVKYWRAVVYSRTPESNPATVH